jgi:hypothetical protein
LKLFKEKNKKIILCKEVNDGLLQTSLFSFSLEYQEHLSFALRSARQAFLFSEFHSNHRSKIDLELLEKHDHCIVRIIEKNLIFIKKFLFFM